MLKINFIWDNLIVSGQRSAVRGQRSAFRNSDQTNAYLFYSKSPQVAWHRLLACDLTHKLKAET
ncbi:hypothetical protein [Moorena sp. SIO3B2]|nr:hypothetical protein [Moorena sp. SIO3B2]NEP32436.1 hypothetical protein [Moorena sp. SIO3B2]NEP67969.1 hypothetical protein [Moorena sp. SIO3A5]